MNIESVKVYVGCALASAPKDFISKIELLKQAINQLEINELRFNVLEFVTDPNATNQEVFENDIGCVKRCDFMVADFTYPSTGLGFEVSTALELGKPVIGLVDEGATISRLVKGIQPKPDKVFKLYAYTDMVEIGLSAIRELSVPIEAPQNYLQFLLNHRQ
jgi:nucleoside 2-deoxyribosyltransferase